MEVSGIAKRLFSAALRMPQRTVQTPLGKVKIKFFSNTSGEATGTSEDGKSFAVRFKYDGYSWEREDPTYASKSAADAIWPSVQNALRDEGMLQEVNRVHKRQQFRRELHGRKNFRCWTSFGTASLKELTDMFEAVEQDSRSLAQELKEEGFTPSTVTPIDDMQLISNPHNIQINAFVGVEENILDVLHTRSEDEQKAFWKKIGVE